LTSSKEHKNFSFFPKVIFLFALGFIFASCSFDYSAGQESVRNKPDITMEKIEYVRVRGGDLLVRFQAESAQRWEERQIMEFKNFLFEQMEDKGETLNAKGRAGAAVVQTETGDVTMSDGVRINIKSEDIIIRTAGLEWIDKDKHLSAGKDEKVEIERTDGTSFIGWGFSADARSRTWAFSGKVEGSYVEKEEKEDSEEGTGKRTGTEWARNADDYLLSGPGPYSQEEFISESTREKKVTVKPAPVLEEK